MMGIFSKIARKPQQSRLPSGPAGARAFAIGDVHGRLDLLRRLLEEIDAECRARPVAQDYIIFLGDLIDRGPDSAGVIDLLIRARPFLPRTIFLMGNHEEMMLRTLSTETERLSDWLAYGGYECAQSYGVEVGKLALVPPDVAASIVRDAIPQAHFDFIDEFVDSFQFGDFLFVHAGIKPGVPIAEQSAYDLRWIRGDFLDSAVDHKVMVVHGHTISDGPIERPNRIGIDTGAYRTGTLTAICIEGTERRFLSATL